MGLLVPSVVMACLWDHDTIKMERSRFPSTLELITGKFLRHTPELYQWRIQNRLNRLESDPTNAALLDDLAVAYDKTGQHDKAIETALRTERHHPGRYETAANLGTFYIHAGKLSDGIPHIDRALKINPDAHFGREKYQKLLVEYVLYRRQDRPLTLPLAEVTVDSETTLESPSAGDATIRDTFAAFVQMNRGELLNPNERAAAVKGILGMMRFGKHDSPVLLEALGTLLVHRYRPTADAKLLAARAFLKASYEVSDEPARVAYRAMASSAMQLQTSGPGREDQVSLEEVEADFQRELGEARAWYTELRDRELSWIREGQNPEAEFDRLYDADPEVSGMEVSDPKPPDEQLQRLVQIGVIIAVATGLAGAIFMVRRVLAGRDANPVWSRAGKEAEPGDAADGGGV
jgi:tetratricopeptide (TPR) repeat protein